MIKLIPNWKKTLKKAWSVRLLILAGILSGLEVIAPYSADLLDRKEFSALMFLITSSALVLRIIAQKESAKDE